MVAMVPSLEGSLYLTDPQSIIGYTLRKMCRTPKDTVPIVPDAIVSFPWFAAKFKNQPDTLCNNMQSSIQRVLSNIFGTERNVNVTVTNTVNANNASEYDINISILYTTIAGELVPIGTTLLLKDGRFVIPEDNWINTFDQQ